jgi:hypothetical protein
MTAIEITSWSHLQDELFRGSWNDSIQRYRSPFVFRGLSDKEYHLETSLMRLGGHYWQLEKHLLRNFRKYARFDSFELGSFWHLLSLAQHYGLPTRLLDWTYSPYIALHFATSSLERFGEDGAIWVVDFEKTHDLLPVRLRNLLRTEGAQAFTVELLADLIPGNKRNSASEESSFHEVVESLNAFDGLGTDEDFLLFFEPPSMNERIVNQFALFSVMPNSRRRIDDWLGVHPTLFRKLIIPAEMKWECRDKLDQCNITERVLFPGPDGLSSWLKRHYSPKIP